MEEITVFKQVTDIVESLFTISNNTIIRLFELYFLLVSLPQYDINIQTPLREFIHAAVIFDEELLRGVTPDNVHWIMYPLTANERNYARQKTNGNT